MSKSHADHADHPHSNKMYYIIYVVLLVLLLLTVGVAYIHLGKFAFAAAILIAVVKAALVILYFMHVADRTPLVGIFAAAGFIWLAILLAGAITDYIARHWIVPPWVEEEPSAAVTAPADTTYIAAARSML